ncbi:succinate dehydrogenase, cytochrome b556 subunit [Amylibacter kogurei]|uniref:Succinate dehydrogenase cytochrome b556 subunit n=1 Tax=Paramylibacter kogurei TaxID=1889778 RepID=A0A2G5K821_9RHOB|nr:succinate dehydrogenase, cytochrome b556 subunit [Amylibacter kogurei]PIB25677.1 succinate dehydrogenase, cytochrome b556 subunit [Amylibacter kogurei]
MADQNRGNRPLSPHLTIYRPQMSSMTSIFVRLTGIALTLGFVMIIWWLIAAASGPAYFDRINGLMTGWFSMLIWIASIWALWYHFLGGVRHLIWDMGYGFDLKTADLMGYIMIGGSFVMTILTFIMIGVCS